MCVILKKFHYFRRIKLQLWNLVWIITLLSLSYCKNADFISKMAAVQELEWHKIYKNRCENRTLHVQISSYITLKYHTANYMNTEHPLLTPFCSRQRIISLSA